MAEYNGCKFYEYDQKKKLVEFYKMPRNKTEMMELLELKDRVNFKNYLEPMLNQEKRIILYYKN